MMEVEKKKKGWDRVLRPIQRLRRTGKVKTLYDSKKALFTEKRNKPVCIK